MADNVAINYVKSDEVKTHNTHKNNENSLTADNMSIELISKYIQYNYQREMEMKENYQRYIANRVPIFNRRIGYLANDGSVVESLYKINRKLNNDFAGYIVRTKASYICSNPVNIEFRDLKEFDEEKFSKILVELDNFKKLNNWDGLMVETAERIGATGEGAWIISMDKIDGQGKEKINNVFAWEVIEIIPDELYVRYYTTTDLNLNEVSYIDVYDSTNIVTYESHSAGSYKKLSAKPHLFKKCPVVMFKNNDESSCDFHNVKSLIDQYDRTLSDLASETEQFRLSYLVLTGVEATQEQVASFQQTGVFQIKKPEGKAEFIIKNIAIQETLILLEKIEKNIFRFAESFDSTSSDYTGDLTNFAIHFKTAPLKGRAKKTSNFMKQGLYKLFNVIQDTWNLKNLKSEDFNYLDMKFTFTFDEAHNLKEEVETISNAGGRISNETLLGLMSFIDSPSNEIMRIKAEQSEEGIYTGMDSIWYNQFNQMQHAMANGGTTQPETKDDTKSKDKVETKKVE